MADFNPLQHMPRREDLPEGKSLGELARTYAPNVTKELEEPYREVKNLGKLASIAAMGEDAEGLPFGAEFVPGVSLGAKLSQGKAPGLLDFLDVPSVKGLAALKAMGPIAATLKEFKAGARMGKTAKNLKKAKNPYIERWHRTRSMNDKSIQSKGLLAGKNNPNYGKNTGDQNSLPIPVNWLGTDPTEVPVLQYYYLNLPDEVSTYRVRIPKDIYYNTPRLKWEQGWRGASKDAVIVPNGESSLTGEVGQRTGNTSLIDLFGSRIRPEWLKKVPNEDIAELHRHHEQMRNYASEHLNGEPSLSEIGNAIVKNEMNNWMPASERYQFGKLFYGPDDFLEDTPQQQLAAAAEAYNISGIPKLGSRILAGDIPDKFDTPWEFYERPNLPQHLSQIAQGFISRGWTPEYQKLRKSRSPKGYSDEEIAKEVAQRMGALYDNWNPKYRMFDWKLYNKMMEGGASPYQAAVQAKPKFRLEDSPKSGLYVRHALQNNQMRGGHISSGYHNEKSAAGDLRDMANSTPEIPPVMASSLRDLISQSSPVEQGAIVDAVMNSKGSLSKLKPGMENVLFYYKPGAIERGEFVENRRTLKQIYDDYFESALSDTDWMYTPEETEEAIEAARRTAGEQLRELMKENAEIGSYPNRETNTLRNIMKYPPVSTKYPPNGVTNRRW